MKHNPDEGLVCACDPAWRLGDGDQRQIRHHMGRVNVGQSYMHVARMMLKLAKHYPRKARHAAARYALACHADNRNEYRAVMSGRILADDYAGR